MERVTDHALHRYIIFRCLGFMFLWKFLNNGQMEANQKWLKKKNGARIF